MFRLWAKVFKDNRQLNDIVICDEDYNKSRTQRIFNAITEVCLQFDLSEPLWLDSNIEEFKKRSKTRFYADNFIDTIEFDFLEVHVIEE